MTKKNIETTLCRALQQGWIREEDSAVIMYDLSFLEKRIRSLRSFFPEGTLHGLAIKANPLKRIMELSRNLGMGVEAASMGEVNMALMTGYPPEKIVYDSPVKTLREIEFALRRGIHINIDNLSELQRVDNLLKSIETNSTIGIRINPQVGVGAILESSVAGEYSKFGVPVRNERAALEQAFLDHPWLTGVHLHVGSQGCPLSLLTDGIGALYDFTLEINEKRILSGLSPVNIFDIGGGLPVSYRSDLDPPSMEEYVNAIRKRAPGLFNRHSTTSPLHHGTTAQLHNITTSPQFRLITEFGRWTYTNAGWTVSRVEYVKHDPGIHTAMIHVGADLFVRECLNPKDWQHEYSLFDSRGRLKKSAVGSRQSSDEGRVTSDELISPDEPYNLAGPLCFSGDILAKGVILPPVEEGDYIAIHDTGSYTFSMWSRYNSRQAPRIIGYTSNGEHFEILREREGLDEVAGFWE